MPKFLLGKIAVTTYEVFADSVEQAEKDIIKWQSGETEEPEGGVRVTKYKLGWTEKNLDDPTDDRNKVLTAFLGLMQDTIPGMPKPEVTKSGLIILPTPPRLET